MAGVAQNSPVRVSLDDCMAALGVLLPILAIVRQSRQLLIAAYIGLSVGEQELARRTSQYLEAEFIQIDVNYEGLTRRGTGMGIKEAKASAGSKSGG